MPVLVCGVEGKPFYPPASRHCLCPPWLRRFVINRRHAEVFVAESKLDAVFDKECFVRKDMVTWKSKPE